MLTEIPQIRPVTPLLDAIDGGRALSDLSNDELLTLCEELRAFLLYSVGQTGGHFGAGMGVVELTVALHHIFNTPDDRIVWDVGHQTYPHKILTGRMQQMHTMRQAGGLSGFPKRSESEYDTFGVGHSSTSISAAMGMALAARQKGDDRKVIAVIGDGAITGGMAFEALAHAGHERPNMLVILNDNQMSIGHNTGGLATYFAKIWASKTYIAMREGSKKLLKRLGPAWDIAKRTEEHMKGMVAPGTLFEELGWHYIGPLDGHDLPQLVQTIENMKNLEGPQILHIRTVKGKGFAPAEQDPVGYHAMNKIEAQPKGPQHETIPAKPKAKKYSDVFGEWLCEMAERDPRLVAITPAMCEGSGMVEFSKRFPDRFYDVAIAEQHAVTLAAGLACEGLKPVVAIYSTFLQRGYDQLIHDVALQNLDVTFAIDRAGLVGEDGPTHHGAFDLSYLRCIPNLMIGAPADENECWHMLGAAYQHVGAASVRYPRGSGRGIDINREPMTDIMQPRCIRKGDDIAVLSYGACLDAALKAGTAKNLSVYDMRWVEPVPTQVIEAICSEHQALITLEDNVSKGGAGSSILETVSRLGNSIPVELLGLGDSFIEHGSQVDLREANGLSAIAVEQAAQRLTLNRNARHASHLKPKKVPA
ncbi:MAG: 1-deoxy-D-xylulose-5-phosphate synthase [Halieaceae bacterium]|nr:1-deoxy-D-xylulose-5-phosphate synthase [Halieaceae bacterium]